MVETLREFSRNHLLRMFGDLKLLGVKFKLNNLDKIIEATSFEFRRNRFPEACPYYRMYPAKSCHDVDDLNCFLCACPNYISDSPVGGCKIKSDSGEFYFHDNLPKKAVWDCSGCSVNHSPEEVRDYLQTHFAELKKIFDSI